MKMRLFAGVAAALCCAGLAMAQPANDNCTGAIGVGIPSVTPGTTVGATVEAGPPQTCTTSYTGSAGVWYTLVGNGNTLTVDTCTSGTFDTKLHVYCSTNANPCSVVTSLSCVGGSDDACGSQSRVTFCSAAGQTYFILVSAFSATTTGTFTLTVADGAPCTTAVACGGTTAGACCNTTTGACTITATQAACTGNFQGIGTACTYVSPCPNTGACCSSTGTCTITLNTSCTGTSSFQGNGTACLPTNPCTALLGACCSTAGACTNVLASGCVSPSVFSGAGTSCGANPCPGAGACCSGTGVCTTVQPASCTGTSAFQGVGSTCLPTNPCTALLGACCSGTGTCTTTTTLGCAATSSFRGVGTVCTPSPCTALVGACCSSTLTCSVTFAPTGSPAGCTTAGSSFQGLGTTCTPNPCSGACCSSTGVCSLTSPTGCVSPSNYIGVGTTCTPTPGPCVQAGGPANDLCANAIMLSAASLPVTADGNNTLASTDPMPAVCASSQKDVWYTFTPMISQNYSVRTCGGLTGTLDTVVSVHTACPTLTANNLLTGACNDDGCSGVGASQISSIALTAGTTYWVRVARFGTTSGNAGGPFTLTIDQITGTCCNPTTGVCSISTQAACGAGTWVLGGVCTTTTCAGACCNTSTGACTTSTDTGCAAGSNYAGAGTTCTPNTCPQFSGGCCATDGTCSIDTPLNCVAPRVYIGNGSTCDGALGCPATGSCCATDGSCTVGFQASCTGGSVWTSGGTCTPNTCPGPGGCCVPGACCVVTLEAACTGTWTAGSTCTPTPCPIANDECTGATSISLGTTSGDNSCATTNATTEIFTCQSNSKNGLWYDFTAPATATYQMDTNGSAQADTVLAVYSACGGTSLACDDDGGTTPANASLLTVALTAGQNVKVLLGTWGSATAGGYTLTIGSVTPLGSCCAADGTCTSTDAANCTATFTSGGTCTPNTCPQPTGACCCGSTCSLTLAAACAGTNQSFRGSGTLCNVAGDNTTPCCKADYNQSGAVSVQDIFDFLAAYFGGEACADINGNGLPLSVQDIFDFLAAYFAGCV